MAAEPSGQDVSQRIRNAIRSKLVDIGCYVDDELPDYVMVMIANKKTKEQMKSDLELFLGEYCGSFCDWLHQVLDHLQRYAREGKKRLPLFDEHDKKTTVGSSEDEVDLHPNAEEARDFPDFDSKDNQESRRKNDLKKSRSPLRKIEEKTKKRLKDRVEEVAKEVKRKDESRATSHRNESSRQRIEMLDDRSRKDASGDEKSLPKKKRTSPDTSRSSKTRDKDRKEDRVEKKRDKTHIERKKLPSEEKEIGREKQKAAERMRPDHSDKVPKNRSSTVAVRSIIKSTVSTKAKDSDSDEYEEYDPSKPQLRSIAKIAPRKKLMAKDSLEKNKLLAKAILDANNSIQQVLSPRKLVQSDPPPSGSSQPKRNIRDRLGAYVTDAIASRVAMVQRLHEMPPSLGDEDEDDENTVSNDRSSKGHVEDLRMSLRKSGREKRKVSEKLHVKEKEIIQESTNHYKRHSDPPDDEKVPLKTTKESTKPLELDQTPPQVAVKPEKPAPVPVVPGLKKEEAKNVILRNGMIVKPSPLLEACGLGEVKKRKIEAPSPSPEDTSGSPAKKIKSLKADLIPLKSLDDLIKPGQVDLAVRPPRRRCHFDPSCTNLSCVFAHPGQPCTSFPHCGLKASVCNFRHPPCYYDKACTSRSCQFNHKHDGMPTPEDAKPAPCKYFPNCTNSACPFYHPPIPCKFGLRCQALSCPFVHPQKSTVAKLKWVAH